LAEHGKAAHLKVGAGVRADVSCSLQRTIDAAKGQDFQLSNKGGTSFDHKTLQRLLRRPRLSLWQTYNSLDLQMFARGINTIPCAKSLLLFAFISADPRDTQSEEPIKMDEFARPLSC
jgi:hypothetical protein